MSSTKSDLFEFHENSKTVTHDFMVNQKNYRVIKARDYQNANPNEVSLNFDLTTLANSTNALNYNEMLLYLPLTLSLTATTGVFDANEAVNDFALSLKNGIFQVLNSVLIKYNNNVINQNNTSYLNNAIAFNVLQMNESELSTLADNMHFRLDSVDSIRYNAAASPQGLGENNNTLLEVLPLTTGLLKNVDNKGRMERIRLFQNNTNFTTFTTAADLIESLKTGIVYQKTATNITYLVSGVIPLNLIHNFFARASYIVGSKLELEFSLNCGSVNFVATPGAIQAGAGTGADPYTYVGVIAATARNYTATAPVFVKSNCCPFMISPLGPLNGFDNWYATAFTASCFIGHNNITGLQPSIFVPAVKFNPDYEKLFLSIRRKVIKYEDHYASISPITAAGEMLNWMINSGISNALRLVIIPTLPGIATGNVAGMSSAMSPYSTAPMTTAPYCKISQLQIAVSGQNLFESPLVYGFQHFLQNTRPELSINGANAESPLHSGLLSQKLFDTAYGYYVIDLNKKTDPIDATISRSVEISCKNLSNRSVQYIFLLYFERQIVIDPCTSAFDDRQS